MPDTNPTTVYLTREERDQLEPLLRGELQTIHDFIPRATAPQREIIATLLRGMLKRCDAAA